MNIFITGINGFIGSSLARHLAQMGHNVSGSVRDSSDLSFLNDLQINIFTGAINDKAFLSTCFKGQEIIFHVAGLASDWGTKRAYYNTNVIGTMNVAQAALAAGVKRLVFVSSTAVYGLMGYRYRTENDPRPVKNFPYAETKREAEDWLRSFAVENNFPITIVQPANVFGPNDRTFFIKFADGLKKGMVRFIQHGTAWTCPTYIDNLTRALWLAATHQDAVNETFIISDGLEINWHQFVEKICRELEVPVPRSSLGFHFVYLISTIIEIIYQALPVQKEPPINRYRIRNFGIDYHFSIEKAKRVLGFSPTVDIDEAVRRTVQWYKEFREKKP
ncbi:MAG TPA: NAD-dependent epimerase/dehydratase family protein [bacterium]